MRFVLDIVTGSIARPPRGGGHKRPVISPKYPETMGSNVTENGNSSRGCRRGEPRFITNGKGHVTAKGAVANEKHRATILDVSRSGLQLELDTPLEPGVQVKVEFSGLIIVGKVLHLRPHLARYRAGVRILQLADSVQAGSAAGARCA